MTDKGAKKRQLGVINTINKTNEQQACPVWVRYGSGGHGVIWIEKQISDPFYPKMTERNYRLQ